MSGVRALIAAADAAGAVLRPRIWCDRLGALPPELRAALKAREAEVLRALVANEVAVETAPAAPCPACGSGVWWRVPVLSGGPGPWTCRSCTPPDPDLWLDGCAVAERQT